MRINRCLASLQLITKVTSPSCSQVPFILGAMIPAVPKLYFVGTMLSILALLYSIVDSFGGLMYIQVHPYMLELEQAKKTTSSTQRRGRSATKHICS